MRRPFRSAALFLLTLAGAPVLAAEPAGNVVRQAADAFGLRVGTESIGLYSQSAVRGFSPKVAGNIRLEGLFFRPAGALTDRAVDSTSIRVGLGNVGQLFPAPSGVADLALRDPGQANGLHATLAIDPYLSPYLELDGDLASADGVWTLASGLGLYPDDNGQAGNDARYVTAAFIPRWRPTDRLTITGLLDMEWGRDEDVTPTLLPLDGMLPPSTRRSRFIGQRWADYAFDNRNLGLIVDAGLADGLALRGGLFHSQHKAGKDAFTLLNGLDATGQGEMFVLMFPPTQSSVWSGESQLSYGWSGQTARQTLTASLRGLSSRERSGGEVEIPLGPWRVDEVRDVPRPALLFDQPQSHDQVRQWAGGVNWRLEWAGRLDTSVGVQKARYRKQSRTGAAAPARGGSDPWLYNALVAWRFDGDITAYASYARGLEEAGSPPVTAINRNSLLPAVLTTQRELGVKLPLGPLNLTSSLFDVRRPYAGLDGNDRYGFLGQVRHRGLEASVTGQPLPGLSLVLGAVLLDPVVTGPEVREGLIGRRPVGQRRLHWQASLDYAPPGWEGGSLDLVIDHRSATTARRDNLANAPAVTVVDLGLRQELALFGQDATLRAQLLNLFNADGWDVVDDGEYSAIDRRAWRVALSTRF
ncbi:TonB-dependent receptor [Niveispirillum sp. BGYR6]|uniref:TonB-dependent siderophore receptor n=1 Tax=Niveispirillum sp. BGYR6 TaxID=2971249 RepID=UPI0022B99B4D|nr:TonB-dependent receptor [Niveispirillum sp. BGYR6]MDG5495685.1 TonB-dependent receptor [Niveispirillum sp. BGYR6]